MYSVKPSFDLNYNVELSSCIYKMQNLAIDDIVLTNVPGETDVEETERNSEDDASDEPSFNDFFNRLTAMKKRIEDLTNKVVIPDKGGMVAKSPNANVPKTPPSSRAITMCLPGGEADHSCLVHVVNILVKGGDLSSVAVYRHSSAPPRDKVTAGGVGATAAVGAVGGGRGGGDMGKTPTAFMQIDNNAEVKLDASTMFVIYRDVKVPELSDSMDIKIQGYGSIIRYLVALFQMDIDGCDDSLSAEMDYYIDACRDIRTGTEQERLSAEQRVRLEINNSKSNCLVGDSLTLADLLVYMCFVDNSISTKGGHLADWAKKVRQRNNIS